jgi:methylmalonyl-CoA mutase
VENHKKKGFEVPKVFLLTYGNLTMRKARAGFSTNFFGVAGYQIIDNPGFQNIEEGVQAAIDQSADIVVLCSSDEEYADMAPAATVIKEKSPKTQVVVAGYPKELLEQLDQAGVDHYIHMRTNLLQALTHFNELMGIA